MTEQLLSGATLADLILTERIETAARVSLSGITLRLCALPILFLLLAKFLPCSIELKRVIVIQAAMPAAMLPIVIAKHYGGDPQTALQIVLSTSLLGLLTIPLWIRIGCIFAGV